MNGIARLIGKDGAREVVTLLTFDGVRRPWVVALFPPDEDESNVRVGKHWQTSDHEQAVNELREERDYLNDQGLRTTLHMRTWTGGLFVLMSLFSHGKASPTLLSAFTDCFHLLS